MEHRRLRSEAPRNHSGGLWGDDTKALPSEAHRLSGDCSTRDVPIRELSPGEKILVKPGEKLPVDGVVSDGRSAVNEALTFIALASCAATLAVWLFAAGRDFDFSLERAVTVMVVTCPHALGLAIPLVVAVSTSLSARNGLLIRNRTAFEKARRIDAFVFDKTGTLTKGESEVTDTIRLGSAIDAEEVLALAAAVESDSEHPIARGILSSVEEARPAEDYRAIPGKGAEVTVEGRSVKVVGPGYLEEKGIAADTSRVDELAADGKTVFFVLVDDKPVGALALADVIREESRAAVSQLKEMRIDPHPLFYGVDRCRPLDTCLRRGQRDAVAATPAKEESTVELVDSDRRRQTRRGTRIVLNACLYALLLILLVSIALRYVLAI